MYRSLLIASAIFFGVFSVQAALPGAIEIVSSEFSTGKFTLRVPASEKPLELYWAAAWADDTDEYSQWRAPVFLQDVPAGTTEVTVTVPGFNPDAASRFFLASRCFSSRRCFSAFASSQRPFSISLWSGRSRLSVGAVPASQALRVRASSEK